jgi:uncharacterized membrane protein
MKNKIDWESRSMYVLAAAMLVVVFLVAGKWSIWFDESYSWAMSRHGWGEIIQRTAYDVHPPLYYLTLKAWSLVVGDSIFVLRLLSWLFGVGTVILTTKLAGRLFGKKVMPIVAIVLAFAPYIFHYSQELRMYSMTAFLGVVSTYILIILLDKRFKNTKKLSPLLVVVYSISAVSLLYTQYVAGFLLLGHWALVMNELYRPNVKLSSYIRSIFQEKWWLVANVIIMVTYLPWLPALAGQITHIRSDYWIPEVTAWSIPASISDLLTGNMYHFSQWLAVFLYGVIGFFIFLLARGYNSKNRNQFNKVLLLFFVPVVGLFLASLPPFTPIYYNRYIMTFAPYFYLSIAVGVTSIEKQSVRRSALLITLFLFVIGLYSVVHDFRHSGWRGADKVSNKIKLQLQPGDIIFGGNIFPFADIQYYFSNSSTKVHLYKRIQPKLWEQPYGAYINWPITKGNSDIFVYGDELSSFLGSYQRVWVLTNQGDEIRSDMPQDFKIIKSEPVDNRDLILYAR